MKTAFLRVLEAEDKANALLEAIRERGAAAGRKRFEVDVATFAAVPRSTFAYWVDERILNLFKELPPFEAEGRVARQGLCTNDDFRWIRLRWEGESVDGEASLVPFAKGGAFSPFYAPIFLAVRWGKDGRWIKEWKSDQLRQELITANNSKCWNESYYFHPGITWPLRTNGLSLRVMPAGCAFGHKGPAAFVAEDDVVDLLALAAIGNSRPFGLLVSLQLARTELAQSYEVGLVQCTPTPRLTDADRNTLANLARRAWSVRRSLDTRTETSSAFVLPALLLVSGAAVTLRAIEWSSRVRTAAEEFAAIQGEIDERCFVLYAIDVGDHRAIANGTEASVSKTESSEASDDIDDVTNESADELDPANAPTLAAELVSWAAGVAFGRFDIRLATSIRPLPAEPNPFDPLPACSPGMLTGTNGLPLSLPPDGYPIAFPEDGVLVDDSGHPRDLTSAVRAVFDLVFGANADRWWSDVAALLDPNGHDLGSWIAGTFFEHHLKRYSKSRRKAPILWQLGTPSGNYSVWLYAHRLTSDTFFQLQGDGLVAQKLAHEERRLTTLIQNAGGSPSPGERKEITAQEALVEELRALLDEVKRIASLWKPNLDDGVVLTMAPLWRLVPQHKPWQKELKSRWDELRAGKSDWAHLAMHLWPERVIPKCATDRSLAIAHGLEDQLWIVGPDGKWKARETPLTPIADLIRDRTSPAVKAALRNLLEAPTASGGGRARGRRAFPPGATPEEGL